MEPTYRSRASCHGGMAIPADRSFSFDSAQNRGLAARSFTSLTRTGTSRASAPSRAASSRASSSHVHRPELTQ